MKPEQVQAWSTGPSSPAGPSDLKPTAIFIGGSDVAAGEAVLAAVRKSHAAAVRPERLGDARLQRREHDGRRRGPRGSKHMDLGQTNALVLGGTGPVGQRVARLLARQGAQVRVGSRRSNGRRRCARRFARGCRTPTSRPSPRSVPADGPTALDGRTWSSPPAPRASCCCRQRCGRPLNRLHVTIDLNAVPPLGIEGVEVDGQGASSATACICYGAIGVGDTKMKIHKAAIAQLFESNDQVLDAEEIYDLALRL